VSGSRLRARVCATGEPGEPLRVQDPVTIERAGPAGASFVGSGEDVELVSEFHNRPIGALRTRTVVAFFACAEI
jgi:hypothetical protein